MQIESKLVDSRRHLPALDGLRGVAILLVFLYHYGAGGKSSSVGWVQFVSAICGAGWSGVDLFFVISGFLITGILLDTLPKQSYYSSFYARRALRILPIYYLTLLVLFVIGYGLGVPWTWGHLLFLFYLGFPAVLVWPGLEAPSATVHFTHLWSLCIEQQFYFLWPYLVRKLESRKRIILACGVAFGLALGSRFAFVHAGLAPWANGFILCQLDSLAIGAAIAVGMRSATTLFEAWRRRLMLAGAVAALAFVALCIACHSCERGVAAVAEWGYSLLAVAYGGLLLASIGPLERIFNFSPLRAVGRYSYGIYLYHFPLERLFEPFRGWLIRHTGSFALGAILYVVICFALNFLLAAMSYHWIESPFLARKKKYN